MTKTEMEAMNEMFEIKLQSQKLESQHKLNRMGIELSTYYADCMEAKDVPMTVELGEVLRDNLMDVFRILSENGIEMDKWRR